MRCKLQAWGLFARDAQALDGFVSAEAAIASFTSLSMTSLVDARVSTRADDSPASNAIFSRSPVVVRNGELVLNLQMG